jgi:transcriptional regulator with XRE-family HTH domain
MALDTAEVREIVERACARPDVLDACRKRDLGVVIEIFGSHGLTQGKIASLTGIGQGRLSQYMNHLVTPKAKTIFENFANGLNMPSAARLALGLSADEAAKPTGASRVNVLPDVGLAYPEAPDEAFENASRLWQADLESNELLEGRLEPAAWNDASLKWLVDPGHQLERENASGVRVGKADVARFRVTFELFSQLDDRFGGGHARPALVQYLHTDASRLLHGQYTSDVGCEIFSAIAEATLLAAWMSYDSVPGSALAQRYFVQALALAQAGNDRLLGASILDAMSHQATYTGRFSEAANLARAALAGTRGIATATLTSHFHAMEARALARLGDTKGCDRALAEAVSEFEQRRPEEDPEWIRYFDEAELSAEISHCLRDLGRPDDASRHASSSLGAVDDATFVRSDFFVMVVLADAHLAAGEVERSCRVALNALNAGEQIRSARCIGYLREFRQHLVAAGASGAIREFEEQASKSRMWRIASRSLKAA